MNYFALPILLQCWTILINASPVGKRKINPEDYAEELEALLYAGVNNIVDVGVSLNIVSSPDKKNDDKFIFFIEAEKTEKEEKRTLFVLRNDVKTKLLDNACGDISIVNATKPVYFGAKDGIYIYNETENTAKKYGTVNDEVISLVGENNTGVIYFLNNQHQLYKVTEEGTKSSIIDALKDAQDITVDNKHHVYYYTKDKILYVYSSDDGSTRKIEGANNISKLNFVKHQFYGYRSHAFFRDDDKFYTIDGQNATAQLVYSLNMTRGATAASGDLAIVLVYARDKKIYAYNMIVYNLIKMIESIFDKFRR